jgi:hypothetical protein
MAIRIYKDKGELKHQHAFNEYGFVQGIDQAEKIVNGKEMKYYLFPDKVCELILRAGEKNQRHFALKTEGIEYNGKKYISDKESESPQHYDAKLKIIGQGFFDFDLYKISVKNCRLERRFSKSYFRADLIAELDSGESVFIEIIKTSEPSEKKEKYIIENQLPTFKIYIDEKGDFIDEKFHFIGNREIESIREKNRRIQFELDESYDRSREAYRLYQEKEKQSEREIQQYEDSIDKEIQGYFKGIKQRIENQKRKGGNIEFKIQEAIRDSKILRNQERILFEKFRQSLFDLQKKARKVIEQIRYYRYESITNLEERNKRLASEIKGMESLFIQTAPLVKWEWVEPRCTKEPQGKNRLLSLKYFMT